MRIAMVAARYLPFVGGVETHIHEVGSRLAALGHQVTILTTDPTRQHPPSETISGMCVRRVPAWPRNRDYYVSPAIYREVMRGSWDVVHFQGYNTFVAPIGLWAVSRRDIPFVLTFHSGGHSSWLRNACRRPQHALLRPLVRRAAQLIAVSRYEATFFSQRMRLDPGRFVVVPNGASLPPPQIGADQRRGNLIISIGRLERYKGHHRVINAFANLLQRIPDAQLRIVGSGPYEQPLRRLVHRLRLEDRVTIAAISAADRQPLSNLLASAGLIVLLSEYEAHPVAIMEALSLRLPTLVSDATGLRELAERGLCRAIPLDTDPNAVACAMAEELGADRQIPDLSLPDWDDCARQLLAIYEAVTARAGRDPSRAGGAEMQNAHSQLV